MKPPAETDEHEPTRSIAQADRQERFVRAALIVAAPLTFAFAALGACLVLTGAVGVGVVTGAAGILAGGGTLLLRKAATQMAERGRTCADRRLDTVNVLLAIQATQTISDPAKRPALVEDLAQRFSARARGAS